MTEVKDKIGGRRAIIQFHWPSGVTCRWSSDQTGGMVESPVSCVDKTGKKYPRGSPTSARNLLLHGGAREWGRLGLHPQT